jgi:hypothetical protein
MAAASRKRGLLRPTPPHSPVLRLVALMRIKIADEGIPPAMMNPLSGGGGTDPLR